MNDDQNLQICRSQPEIIPQLYEMLRLDLIALLSHTYFYSSSWVAWPSGKAGDCNSPIPSSNLGATFFREY